MTYLSKEHAPDANNLPVIDVENSKEGYLNNLILLGRIAAKYGHPKPGFPTGGNTSWTTVESTLDPRQGFEVDLHFLRRPHRVWKIQNHEYPYLVVSKRGEGTGLFGQTAAQSNIKVILKADLSTTLEVYNNPGSRTEYMEALDFDEPEELLDNVEGISRRLQSKFIAAGSFVSYSAYPNTICPAARAMLVRVINEAVSEFSGLTRLDPGIGASQGNKTLDSL